MEKKVLTSSIFMRQVRHHSEFISYNFKIKYKYRVQKNKTKEDTLAEGVKRTMAGSVMEQKSDILLLLLRSSSSRRILLFRKPAAYLWHLAGKKKSILIGGDHEI